MHQHCQAGQPFTIAQHRAVDIEFDIDTDLEPDDITNLRLAIGTHDEPKWTSGPITPTQGGRGLIATVTIPDSHNVDVGSWRYELAATATPGGVRTLAESVCHVTTQPVPHTGTP